MISNDGEDDVSAGSLGEPDIPPADAVPVPTPASKPTVLPAAEISQVVPDHGPVTGFTKVAVRGANLQRESIVRIGGVLCMTIGAVEGGSELRVESPPRDKAGTVDISVENPGAGTVTKTDAFRYEALPAPTITSVAPQRGAVDGGTELHIGGTNFVEQSVVLLDGKDVSNVKFIDSTSLDIKTPAGKAGKMIDVTVKNPDGKKDVARRAFMYDDRY